MNRLLEGLGATAGVAFALLQAVLVFGTSMGVVRENCLDLASTRAAQSIDVDTGWTYILWPPLPFANVDPAGGCVRNSPLREGLAAVGIWELSSPEEQVVDHLRKQDLLQAAE